MDRETSPAYSNSNQEGSVGTPAGSLKKNVDRKLPNYPHPEMTMLRSMREKKERTSPSTSNLERPRPTSCYQSSSTPNNQVYVIPVFHEDDVLVRPSKQATLQV